jgi:hypothetical protein
MRVFLLDDQSDKKNTENDWMRTLPELEASRPFAGVREAGLRSRRMV